jgi:hypothetical protein
MDENKQKAIENLIDVFANEFPRRNHIILVDMCSGSYRVDEMLRLEIQERRSSKECCTNIRMPLRNESRIDSSKESGK